MRNILSIQPQKTNSCAFSTLLSLSYLSRCSQPSDLVSFRPALVELTTIADKAFIDRPKKSREQQEGQGFSLQDALLLTKQYLTVARTALSPMAGLSAPVDTVAAGRETKFDFTQRQSLDELPGFVKAIDFDSSGLESFLQHYDIVLLAHMSAMGETDTQRVRYFKELIEKKIALEAATTLPHEQLHEQLNDFLTAEVPADFMVLGNGHYCGLHVFQDKSFALYNSLTGEFSETTDPLDLCETLMRVVTKNFTLQSVIYSSAVSATQEPQLYAEPVSSSLLLKILSHPATKVAGAILLLAGVAGIIVGSCGLAGVAIGVSALIAKIFVGVGSGIALASAVGFFAVSNVKQEDSVAPRHEFRT
jgi:hypothetical protein